MQTIINPPYACEKFASVYEFIHALNNRQVNSGFFERREDLASQRVDKDRWSGTATWDEAVRIFKNGYSDGMEHITRGLRNVSDPTPKPRFTTSVVGCGPHVPNYLKGRPDNMIHRKRIPVDTRVLNVYYDRVASWNISTEELERASHLVLAAMRHLEAHGYHIGLNVMDVTCGAHQTAFPIVNVKQPHASVNPLLLAYPMVHPAFFRRHCFRWHETSPILTDKSYQDGYGSIFCTRFATIDERRRELIDHGIIGERDIYIDQAYMSKVHTADALIEYIEQTYSSSAAAI